MKTPTISWLQPLHHRRGNIFWAAATHGSIVYSGPWVPTVLHLHLKLFGLSLQLLFHFTFCIQAFLHFPSLWDPGCEPAKRTNEKLVRGMRSKTQKLTSCRPKGKMSSGKEFILDQLLCTGHFVGPNAYQALPWLVFAPQNIICLTESEELKQVHSNPKL